MVLCTNVLYVEPFYDDFWIGPPNFIFSMQVVEKHSSWLTLVNKAAIPFSLDDLYMYGRLKMLVDPANGLVFSSRSSAVKLPKLLPVASVFAFFTDTQSLHSQVSK